MTKNNAALRILQEQDLIDSSKMLIIFGSSFPLDQEYTQICTNINRIKIAMEIGQTVILCNLSNLYESLYDALNQNYSTYGGKRYVDLGLGTHRVKCRVHEDFRLIVVAEDKEVYEKFPIPLINRLEKHFLGMETMTTPAQEAILGELKDWTRQFCEVQISVYARHKVRQFTPEDAFIGYHEDVIASMIMRYSTSEEDWHEENLITKVKESLLLCATPDAVSRLSETNLPEKEKEWLFETYYMEQKHDCLSSFLSSVPPECQLIQVTTRSSLLTMSGKDLLAEEIGVAPKQIDIMSLVQFNTENQFSKGVEDFLDGGADMLLIQSEIFLDDRQNLVECARYNVSELIKKHKTRKTIVFVLHVPRVAGGCFNGLCVHPWISVHIDELRRSEDHNIDVFRLKDQSVPEVLEQNLVNFEKLLIECLPKAASSVKQGDNRMQERIEILVGMVDSESDNDVHYFKALRSLILGAIKDNSKQGHQPEKWLVKIAINSEFLKEGNTFQKAIWLHLADIVTPILTQVISFCDLDCGLNLLTSSSSDWVSTAFLEMLTLSTLNEMKRTAGYGGGEGTFESKFPMSRYLVSTIDSWSDSDEKQNCAKLQAMLQGIPQASIIKYCFDRPFEGLQKYLHDFVHIKFSKFTGISDMVTEFICSELFKLTKIVFEEKKEMLKMETNFASTTLQENESDFSAMETDENSPWMDFINPADVHVAYETYKKRLNFAFTLCVIMPEIPKRLIEKQTFEADFKGFEVLLKGFEPDADSLCYPANRQSWINKVKRVEHLYHQLKNLSLPEASNKAMPEIKAQLRRLLIVRMYLKHLADLDGDDEKMTEMICKRVKGLSVKMKNNDLKSAKAFRKLTVFLESLNEEVGRIHFGGQDVCIVCKEDMKEPVQLECKHWGCEECLIDHFAQDQAKDWLCPETYCDFVVPKTFNFAPTLGSQVATKRHATFKKKVNSFFLEVLQTFVFQEEPPHEDVIDLLMSFIVTEKLPKDFLVDGKRTKQISPFAGHCIDATPIIRSFILQVMLLSGDQNQIQKHLGKFLQEEKKFVRDPSSFLELYLLIVYCLEDYLSRGDHEDKPVDNNRGYLISERFAYQCLKLSTDAARFEEEIDKLTHVARARLAMATIAEVLRAVLERGGPEENQSKFLNSMTPFVVDHPVSECLKRFLVRIMVHRYRRDIICEWKNSHLFLDLLPKEILESGYDDSSDSFLVLGPEYKRIRDSLRLALTTENFEGYIDNMRHQTFGLFWNLAFHYNCVQNRVPRTKLDPMLQELTHAFPGM